MGVFKTKSQKLLAYHQIRQRDLNFGKHDLTIICPPKFNLQDSVYISLVKKKGIHIPCVMKACKEP